MIGFVTYRNDRTPIFSTGGRKLGYVRIEAQQHIFEDEAGRMIAKILRYKEYQAPVPVQSACGGSFIPES